MAEPAVALFRDAAALAGQDLVDWGPVAEPIGAPVARTRGRLLYRAAGDWPEAGYWECTPGRWRCAIERDEFCHFLAGRAVYTADDGGEIEIAPGAVALFPAGWRGECRVVETLRKVYMIA